MYLDLRQQAQNVNSKEKEQKHSQDNVEYDPFGVLKAAAEAQTSKPPILLFGAGLVSTLLILVAASPFLLLLSLSVFSLVSSNPVVFYFAVILWVWMLGFVATQLRLIKAPKTSTRSGRSSPENRGNVVVIGAGPIGLAVVKECIEQGLNVECFERKKGLGGVYHFDEARPGGVWKGARLTSSPWITAFSDYPPDSDSSIQHKHSEYLDYLESYADNFQLRRYIHFGHTVDKIEKAGEGWQVTVQEEKTSRQRTIQCSHVAICSGVHQHPKPVTLPGSKSFNGTIRHVSNYKGPNDCEGKRVVVVGLGESGADIAYEISAVAKSTLLSIYKGKFILPRINPLTGRANDYDTNRLRNGVPKYLRDWFMSFKRKLCRHMAKHTRESAVRTQLLQISGTGATSQTATKSDDFIKPLLEGRLSLRHEVVGFDKDSVIFADGRRESADLVYFAHGYCPEFPFLELPPEVNARSPSQLYLQIFHPEIGDSLAFCGFARPALGAIPPIGELQARLFAQIAAGQRMLPGKSEMLRAIETDLREKMEHFPLLSKEHVVVAWIPYMDKLADFIGCRPNPWQLLFHSPSLLWKLAVGPCNGAQYRLHGMGKANIAFQTIRALPRDHKLEEIITLFGLHFWVWPLSSMRRNARFHSQPFV